MSSTTFLSERNGGQTDENGITQVMSRLLVQGTPTNQLASSMQCLQHAGGANMSVDVQIGDVIIPNPAGTYSYSGWTTAVQNVTIATAPVSNSRIDTVVAYVNLSIVSSANPNNPGALAFVSVAGTVAASPVAPSNSTIQAAVGAGTPWTPLANIAVGTSVTSIVNANITDTRYPWAVRANVWGGSSNTIGHIVPNVADDTVALLNAAQTFTNKTFGAGNNIITNGWQASGATFTYSANNGNKEFVLGTSTNLTGTLSPGMKLQVTRGTVPPTQCMAFASASSQYATKASPSGITFGSAFTCEAWIYLNSYNGQQQFVIGRSDNSTGGFGVSINASGQVEGLYGASSAFTAATSYQAVPLNQWTHIAFVVSSVSSKTCLIYINGLLVLSTLILSAATSLTQTSNLSVGAAGAGVANSFLNGFISEARIWSAAQSQANIQANMAISISGSATNLVAYYQGNGAWTDGTSNANTLTADGGAINNQLANPYNAIEYGVINTVTSSSITVDCGTSCTIPNETLSSPFYSLNENPYGLTPGLGNNRTLGISSIAYTFSTQSTSPIVVGGLTVPVTIPGTGRQVRIKVWGQSQYNATTNEENFLYLFSGATSGALTNQLALQEVFSNGSAPQSAYCEYEGFLPPGSLWISAAAQSGAGSTTYTLIASTSSMAFLQVEVIS